MNRDRRSVIATLGLALPLGLAGRASASPTGVPPELRLRSFEDAVRAAFASGTADCRRIEVGHSPVLDAGVQGCTNDRPFAGFPAGHLRIVRSGSAPGPTVGGVRLYVGTVDVVATGGAGPGRPLDFASLPPAPVLIDRSGHQLSPLPTREEL